jgi:hypothetical protein
VIDEDDFWRNWWNEIGRGNRSTRRKPAPAALCPPENPTESPAMFSAGFQMNTSLEFALTRISITENA